MMAITYISSANPTIFGNALSFITTPIQSGLSKAGGWIRDRIDFFTGMSDLYDENQLLRDRISQLQFENSRVKLLEQENTEMAALLATTRMYAYPSMFAMVMSYDPGNWYKRFIIDKGAEDGIKNNMVVLADGALAGFISQVRSHSSRVTSIIDGGGSGVSAKVTRTEDIGNVKGDPELMLDGLCLMEFNTTGVDIAVGDEIRTSQISSIYPPDILIGTVKEVMTDVRGMRSAVIEPVMNFSLVKSVLVITELYGEEDLE
jgi:rod shape-determining protein MreC